MSEITRENIEKALKNVIDRDSGANVIEAGLVSGIRIHGGKVSFLITIPMQDKERKAYLRQACEDAVAALSGIEQVTAVMTAQSQPPAHSTAAKKPAQWNLTPL